MHPIRQLVALILVSSFGTGAGAQVVLDDVRELDFDRPESWAMKYTAAASIATGFGVPRALEPGHLEVGLEGGWLPTLSEEERRVGFNGSKVEDINRTSLFGRARLLVGLPAKLSLEVGFVPPVELDGIEPNLVSASLGRPLFESGRWRVGARIGALHGRVEGDIVCSADEAAVGLDPVLNPFLCEAASNDQLTLSVYTVEVSAALELSGSNVEPYAALALHETDLEFQLDARWSGLIDRTLNKTDGSIWNAAAGFQYTGWERSSLAVELFYSPLDVQRPPSSSTETDELFNVRALFRYKIR